MADEKIRASWLKFTMRTVRRLPGDGPERVKQAMGSELLSQIYEATALAWLPGASFIQLCESLSEALGVHGARDFWSQSLRAAIDQPLIRPLAQGGLTLFGRTPGAFVRRTPQAWALVTRKMGTMHVEPGGDTRSLRVYVQELPPSCRSMALLLMWEGGFQGQAAFLDMTADVRTDASDLARGGAAFEVRW